jgi:hypothetical protein
MLCITPVSMALLSTSSISEKRMRSSNPDDVLTPDTTMSSTSFWHLSASLRRFVSSRRSSEDEMFLLANDSRN